MIGIMKDCAFHWRFNDTENKLKASTLPVRVLRDSRQIFVQCRERKKRNHPKSTTQTKQKKKGEKKKEGEKKALGHQQFPGSLGLCAACSSGEPVR